MSFNSLEQLVGAFIEQNALHERPLLRVVKCWAEVVGAAVAAHTRPLAIQRNILWVATSSAAWAQNLTFERQRILTKLNPYLPPNNLLVDIRFSTAGWQRSPNTKQEQTPIKNDHPSYIVTAVTRKNHLHAVPENPRAAFQHWQETMRSRAQGLPLCPQCQCPTPPGELQRWTVCSFCAAKKW
ncbi:DciA family protein [Chroococcidiopsis sp. TS-821]|uniref:DciA family protein n=1 Tax=Chroococcidiopsis sp. TS-821 TaxID=1378066 RepID=UPI000CEEE91B|nr:DciA family protein [Chroococcidiopsis sp. TS-821]PPS44816.1 RNA-binding protein [Chroococcidiopsis sp. TS-821]